MSLNLSPIRPQTDAGPEPSHTLPGFDAPAVGFDQPYEMLHACHDSARRMLALLVRLCGRVHTHEVDDVMQSAARDVRRYFTLAAPAHHEDEERHIVPLLRASPDPRLNAVARRIETDHRQMSMLWRLIEADLQRLQQGLLPHAAFGRHVEEFVRVHDAHLALEDEVAFPTARGMLGEDGAAAVHAMGREMAARRAR